MNSTINNQPSTVFPHEKLEVWQLAKSLAGRVYMLTSGFPKEERFGLVDQMRRAGVSVMSNLAEGCGRTSARDQAHFSQLAFGSLLELDAQLQLSLDLNFLQANDYQVIRPLIMELIKKISALRASQLKRVEQ
jgi:four helix bundle protein